MLTGDTLSGISPPRTKEAAMRNSKRKYAGTGGARDGYELKIRLKSKKGKRPARSQAEGLVRSLRSHSAPTAAHAGFLRERNDKLL